MKDSPGAYEPTPSELWQMKIVYIAVYIGLGLIDENRLFLLNDVALRARPMLRSQDKRDVVSVHSATSLSREYFAPEPTHASFKQKFPSLQKTLQAFKASIRKISREQALAKWRWSVRDNSDSFVLRYVRQFGNSKKAASHIGQGLVWQSTVCNAEDIVTKGEGYWIHTEPDPKYIDLFRQGTHILCGRDKTRSPVFLCRARLHDPKAASKAAMRRMVVNILEHAWRSYRDDSPGGMLVWDLTAWKPANYDAPLIIYMIQTVYKCYPMIAGRIFLYNSPLSFKLIWKHILSKFDPIIASRSGFLYGDGLLRFIDASELPESMGGAARDDRMAWTDPNPEDDVLLKDTEKQASLTATRLDLLKQFEAATIQWLYGDKDLTHRYDLQRRIKDNFWQLDAYTRPRHLWDRKGLLQSYRPEFEENATIAPTAASMVTGVETVDDAVEPERVPLKGQPLEAPEVVQVVQSV